MPKSTRDTEVIEFNPTLDGGFDKTLVKVYPAHQVNFTLKKISGGPAKIRVEITAIEGTTDHTKLFGGTGNTFDVEIDNTTQKTVQPHEFGPGKPEKYVYKYERAPLFREGKGPVGGMTGTITVSPTPGE
jgi:hypothetical protein